MRNNAENTRWPGVVMRLIIVVALCHCISSHYNTETRRVDGNAKFLPFDPFTFKYAPQEGFSLTTQFAVASDGYVPEQWRSADVNGTAGSSTYPGIIKQGCRSCHVSSTIPTLDFLEPGDWTSQIKTDDPTRARHAACRVRQQEVLGVRRSGLLEG